MNGGAIPGTVNEHKVHIPDWHNSFHEYACEFTGPPFAYRQALPHTLSVPAHANGRHPADEAGAAHAPFAIDGKVVAAFTKEKAAVYYPAKYSLILNTAVGGEVVEAPRAATAWPALHIVDYVRVARRHQGGVTRGVV